MGTGFSSLFDPDDDAPSGRTVRRPGTTSRNRRAPPQVYPAGYKFVEYGNDIESNFDLSNNENATNPIKLTSVDLNIAKNAECHHTNLYSITEETTDDNGVTRPPQLIVRRGQAFEITLTFDRAFNNTEDELRLLFEIGSQPKESKGTLIDLNASKIKRGDWYLEITNIADKVVTVEVQASPSAIVGKWELIIHTSLASAEGQKLVYRYIHNHPVYILFNPWCKDDTVYMEDDLELEEYILNETGQQYRGTSKQIGGTPWNFGQFQDDILDCCLFLLDKSINYQGRNSPVHVVRAISAIVNSSGDRGVLSGKWSGKYEGGVSPTAWIGSVKILQEYYSTKKPVKYGQCWVFSGVVTTVCRSIGIPARSVTNFCSAHDCDDNITIDKHWDIDGKPIKSMNDDSVWNFHVWNEAWMTRPDLPVGYGGWQAFDATPQETSGGVYCAGPASVKAIREGMVNLRYDTAFIYAEVNADRVHWKQQKDGKFKVSSVEEHVVGKNISTHQPEQSREDDRGIFSFFSELLSPERKGDDRLDITNQYKFTEGKKISTQWPRNVIKDKCRRNFRDGSNMSDDPARRDLTDEYKFAEGSEQERASMYRANLNCSKPGKLNTFSEKGEADVKFSLNQKDNIFVGSPFNVHLVIMNKSRYARTVHGSIRICPVHYTGVGMDNDRDSRDLKTKEFDVELKAVKSHDEVMRLTVDDYVDRFLDQVSFEIYVSATVEETAQTYLTVETYRLRRPDIQVTAPKTASIGETITVKLFLLNPLPLELTECIWDIEGPGISKLKQIAQKSIDPNDQVTREIEITPKKAGKKTIMASFTSKQLKDITGSCSITVEK